MAAKIRVSRENPAGKTDTGMFYAYDEFNRLLCTGASEDDTRRAGEDADKKLRASEGR